MWKLIEKQCLSDVITDLDDTTSRKHCFKNVFQRNMKNPILLKFGTKLQLKISNKYLEIVLRNDVTVTPLLFWRTESLLSTLPKECCHSNWRYTYLDFCFQANSLVVKIFKMIRGFCLKWTGSCRNRRKERSFLNLEHDFWKSSDWNLMQLVPKRPTHSKLSFRCFKIWPNFFSIDFGQVSSQ